MDAILQMRIFFFISSVGFIILWLLIALFLLYLVRAMRTFSRIMSKIERDMNSIGDTTKEMLNDLRDSFIFNFLFGKRRKNHKN